jgi:hypothetical protein
MPAVTSSSLCYLTEATVRTHSGVFGTLAIW